MKVFFKGSSRWVFVIGNFALKIPSLKSWRRFLYGLLANMQELEFNTMKEAQDKLCPIKFYFPLGFLVIMPKVRVLKDGELTMLQLQEFCINKTYVIPAEHKCDSFGYLNGKLVAIDYGD